MQRYILLLWMVVLFQILSVSNGFAQWKLINRFHSQISCVKFDHALSGYGFVGLGNGQVWRTTDQGQTWSLALKANPGKFVSDIELDQTGYVWITAELTDQDPPFVSPGLFRSSNWGNTWDTIFSNGNFVGISLDRKREDLLLTSIEGGISRSTDKGNSWQIVRIRGSNKGFYLSDSVVVTSGAPYKTEWYRSIDAGTSWQKLPIDLELWEASHIDCPFDMVVGLSEMAIYDAPFIFSDDKFNTWTITHSGINSTGSVRIDSRSYLYTQGIKEGGRGFFVSRDLGRSWQALNSGPTNIGDNRFDIVDDVIFAGNDGGTLYQYVIPGTERPRNSPLFINPIPLSFSTEPCLPKTNVLDISGFDACIGSKVIKATLTDSTIFHMKDSYTSPVATLIPITFQPNETGSYSTKLLLQCEAGGKVVDTVVTLQGVCTSSTSFTFSIDTSPTAQEVFPGDTIEKVLHLRVPNPRGGPSVQIALDGETLEFLYVGSNEMHTHASIKDGRALVDIDSLPESLPFYKTDLVLKARVLLSREDSARISFSQFNTSALDKECSFSTPLRLTIPINKACRDSLLLDYLKLITPFTVSSVSYDQRSHSIEVKGTSNSTELEYTLVDLLGRVMGQGKFQINSSVSVPSLSSGTYILVIEMGDFVTSQKIIITP